MVNLTWLGFEDPANDGKVPHIAVHSTFSCGGKYTSEFADVVLDILLSGFYVEISDFLQEFFPVDIAKLGQVKDFLQLLVDNQESYILERQFSISNDKFKLLAELLNILGGLEQVWPPIEGIVGLFDHLGCNDNELGHDAVLHQIEDALVIVVLIAAEKADFTHGVPVFQL